MIKISKRFGPATQSALDKLSRRWERNGSFIPSTRPDVLLIVAIVLCSIASLAIIINMR